MGFAGVDACIPPSLFGGYPEVYLAMPQLTAMDPSVNVEVWIGPPITKTLGSGVWIDGLWPNIFFRKHGSSHFTPEHCLVNGGFPLFVGGKSNMFQMGKTYLLRSPGKPYLKDSVEFHQLPTGDFHSGPGPNRRTGKKLSR